MPAASEGCAAHHCPPAAAHRSSSLATCPPTSCSCLPTGLQGDSGRQAALEAEAGSSGGHGWCRWRHCSYRVGAGGASPTHLSAGLAPCATLPAATSTTASASSRRGRGWRPRHSLAMTVSTWLPGGNRSGLFQQFPKPCAGQRPPQLLASPPSTPQQQLHGPLLHLPRALAGPDRDLRGSNPGSRAAHMPALCSRRLGTCLLLYCLLNRCAGDVCGLRAKPPPTPSGGALAGATAAAAAASRHACTALPATELLPTRSFSPAAWRRKPARLRYTMPPAQWRSRGWAPQWRTATRSSP